jgi:arylsulfatase A-like enzyme
MGSLPPPWSGLRVALLAAAVVSGVSAPPLDRLSLPPALGRPPTRSAAGSPARPPDVVLLVMDTTRRDHLSLYGYARPTTPHLDALAAGAAVYEDAWSVAPWTSPSHASILTGLLPAEHGVDGQDAAPLPAGLVTLPAVLRRAGYRTGGFVANPNLAAPGWSRGFDAYRAPPASPRFSLRAWLDLRRVAGPDDDPWLRDDLTRGTFDLALRWWDGRRGGPRFLFINLLDPHGPYSPPRPFFERFLPGMEPAAAYAVSQDPDAYQLRPGLSERQAAILNGLYDAEIAAMDEQLGRFAAALRSRGELDRTVLVVTADHGERLGERGLVGHESACDRALDAAVLRVPLIVRFPPRVAADRLRPRFQLSRLPARILDLAGVAVPRSMRSTALPGDDRELVVAQLQEPAWIVRRWRAKQPGLDLAPLLGDRNFVAAGRFACTCPAGAAPGGPCVLNDLELDPSWTRDVGPAHPRILARLAAAARALPAYRPVRPSAVAPELRRRLKAIGYGD